MPQEPGVWRSPSLRRAWPLAPALAILLLMALVLSCSRYGRASVSSFFFLPDLMMQMPVRPVTWVTDEPVVEHITLTYGDHQMPADIYRPADGKQHGAVILSPGAPPLEPDDSRLVRLAGDVARAGFVMLVPFSPDLEDELILPREVDALVAAFEYLERQPYVKPDKIGYFGVSIGSSLALLAAADGRINEDVALVIAFGGYYDTFDLLASITTGVISYNGHEESWDPKWHTVKVMSKQVIERLDDEKDKEILTRIFVDQEPEPTDDRSHLSAEGRAAYDLLTNSDPTRVAELVDALPAAAREWLRSLSLAGRLGGLRAETFILHDRSDRYIPYVESRRLRDALEGQVKLHYTEVNIFEHVEPTANRAAHLLVVDSSKLFFHLYQILLRLS
jgi:pimeloyl-ACP methyl ester carboxylesterase